MEASEEAAHALGASVVADYSEPAKLPAVRRIGVDAAAAFERSTADDSSERSGVAGQRSPFQSGSTVGGLDRLVAQAFLPGLGSYTLDLEFS